MTDRIHVHALHPGGASDSQVPTYDAATGRVVWADGSSGGAVSFGDLADVDMTTTPPAVGQVPKWNGDNWVPADDATVSGGGGGGSPVYFGRTTPGTTVTPSGGDVLVPGLSVAVPSGVASRTMMVAAQVIHDGGHSMRLRVYLDGVIAYPAGSTGANAGASRIGSSGNTLYEWALAALAFPVDGAAHTVEVRWQASDSLAAVNIKNGALRVEALG